MSQLPGQYPEPEERGPELPPPPPTYGDLHQPSQLPPPPTYGYEPGPAAPPLPPGGGARQRNGFLGWLGTLIAGGFALFKYAFFIVPYGKTLITLVISFGAYAIFFGPWFAAGLVVMIVIHEF